MNILVTGATGHIGGNLVRILLDRGHRVRALVRGESKFLDGLDLERVTGDLRDVSSLEKAVQGINVVIHSAAIIDVDGKNRQGMQDVNVTGTESLLTASKNAGVERFIYLSSIHAYHQNPRHEALDEDRPLALGPKEHPYDRSKAMGQKLVLEANTDGFATVVVNPTGVIGPHDYIPSRMGDVLLKSAQGKMPGSVNSGFDWVDARDVSLAIANAIEKGRPGEAYLLSGHWVSFKDIARELKGLVGKGPFFFVPLWLAYVAVPFAALVSKITGKPADFSMGSLYMLRVQCKHLKYDKAKRDLGHDPRPFKDTLHDTMMWFRDAGHLSFGEDA